MVGTFRSESQFHICYDKKFYYIPAKQLSEDKLPIHYIALYQTKAKFGSEAGIRYYGEVLHTTLVKRSSIKEIPHPQNKADELYYRFQIRDWKELAKPILPKEKGFVYGDIIFSFSQDKIIALSNDKIIDTVAITDFAKKPAETFRRLVKYTESLEGKING